MSTKKIRDKKRRRIFKKSTNFKEAEDWDIQQYLQMSSEERQEIARILRERVFGKDVPDIREVYKK